MSDKEHSNHSQEDSAGFKVSDRRKFSSDGELRDTVEEVTTSAAPDPGPAENAKTQTEPEDDFADGAGEQIDFASFVLSLATTALAHLGEVPDPATGEKTENLVAAKQMIDILSLLEIKTKGNLQADEERLLESLLYELRMKYLNSAKIITV